MSGRANRSQTVVFELPLTPALSGWARENRHLSVGETRSVQCGI